jgi:hypothetical protein
MERRWGLNNVADFLEECFQMIHTAARGGKALGDIYFISTEIP